MCFVSCPPPCNYNILVHLIVYKFFYIIYSLVKFPEQWGLLSPFYTLGLERRGDLVMSHNLQEIYFKVSNCLLGKCLLSNC